MALPDMNTLLSLNKDPKSIDIYNNKIAGMKKGPLDPLAKHSFIEDRARTKNIKNIKDLYSKLNELEKNGVLDIWIDKFGKDKYRGQALKESTIEIAEDILYENGKLYVKLDKASIVEEMDGAAAAGFTSSGSGPAAYMVGKTKHVVNKYPESKLLNNKIAETHQDTSIQNKDV
jgi:hypothetical protein